ncbi:MAG: RHS repeat-associated core domain-containing protein [Clostridia bacterium]|nr:RHS repeat-associated core domain-containing protein [Clostridia bacterium]
MYLNSRYYDPKVGRFINADDIGYLGANGDLQAFNLFAYCSNNPVMYVDNEGDSATAILGAAIASTPIGALLFLGIVAMSAILSGVKEEAKSESKAENDITEEKLKLDIALEKNNRRKIVFPQNPFEFKPLGLVMKVHPGTKNGRVISWMDPIKNEEVFRWDENINVSNGPHYHINNIIFAGIHFYAYDKIPEPYRTIYFSFLK